jgi:hypothetical protein
MARHAPELVAGMDRNTQTMQMKESPYMKTIIAVASVLLAGTTQASTFTGALQSVQSQVSPTTPGNTRVSIQAGNTTNCSGQPGYYSFDLPNSSVAAMWEATLLAAIAANNPVKIVGTGVCDAYGLETVSIIYALP